MRIGLTGNIACGKSTITNALSQLGVKIVDADKIAHIVLQAGGVKLKIYQFFGPHVFNMDGSVNRKELGKIVFADREKMEALESITRPRIYEAIEDELENFPNCILDSFAIFDTPLEKLVDEIWIVDCPREIQLHRLMIRNNLPKKEALQRICAQTPMLKYIDRAKEYYRNDGTEKELLEHFVPRYFKRQGIWQDYWGKWHTEPDENGCFVQG